MERELARAAAGTPKVRGKTGAPASTGKAGGAGKKSQQKDAPTPPAAATAIGRAASTNRNEATVAGAKGPARSASGTTSKRAVASAKAGAPAKGGSVKGEAKATAVDPTRAEMPNVSILRRSGSLRSASIPLPEPPKKPPTPLPAVTLAKLRRLLEEERATYLRQADELAAEAEALTAEREPGDTQFDEESGEGDTIAVERERDLALSASARQAVEEIDRAIARMDGGTFGYCAGCGNKIPMARLEALPYAALCISCKSREERRR